MHIDIYICMYIYRSIYIHINTYDIYAHTHRLTLNNAMTYNSKKHALYGAAKRVLKSFHDHFAKLQLPRSLAAGVLQCVAVCCSVLQCVAVCCSELQSTVDCTPLAALECMCVAVRCSAACCSMFFLPRQLCQTQTAPRVAVRCIALQCSVL